VRLNALITAATAAVLIATPALARDQIRIVGSSTVFPFTTTVAEQFGKVSGFKTPVVESTGTGGGMKLFCAGIGVDHPDFTNASRRMKKTEFDDCTAKGIQIVELMVGYDGLTIANSRAHAQYKLSTKDVWTALAREIEVGGKLVANPHKTWNQIRPDLPNERIEVYGPPPTSGTRDSFVELILEPACKKTAKNSPAIAAAEKENKKWCQLIREDGAFIEAGENDNVIVQKLVANPKALGVFGYSFLEQNQDKLQPAAIDGVEPSMETVQNDSYPASRSMFFYLKKNHIGTIPGMVELITEYASDNALGEDGYLVDKGLIPAPKAKIDEYRASVKALSPLTM